MKNKSQGIKSYLRSSNFNFAEPEKASVIDVETIDSIRILEVRNDIVVFDLNRKVIFKTIENSVAETTYRVNLKFENNLTKDDFIKEVQDGIEMLSEVFAKMSLTISNMTALSLLGAIITPPIYDAKNIIIE